MPTWILSLLYLFVDGLSARRDAQLRFFRTENRMLRARLPGKRVISTPQERTQLLTIGAELDLGALWGASVAPS